jgi:hypothetical protein
MEAETSLKTLEDIIVTKRKQVERNNYANSVPLAEFYDREKLAFLEPILNVLKDIQTRLDVLEKKTNPSP